MKRRLAFALALPLLSGCAVLAVQIVLGPITTALSSTVDVDIPAGIIAIQGKTSPFAQVRIFEDSSVIPSASSVATSDGAFYAELPQDATGTVKIRIQATDQNGTDSPMITKEMAVIPQQTSTFTVLMPPTSIVTPSTLPYGTGVLTFSGQTVPYATVFIAVTPSLTISATAESDGWYTLPYQAQTPLGAGIYAFSVQVASDGEESSSTQAGTFIIAPPATPPTPYTSPRGLIFSQTTRPTAPVILSPKTNEHRQTQPFIITGTATPWTTISIYDGEIAIGSVLTGSDGRWQFYFSPFKQNHSLSMRACEGETCSEPSRTLTVIQEKSPPQHSCELVTLKEYRLYSRVGDLVELERTSNETIAGILSVHWGDDSSQPLTISNGTTIGSHSYTTAGTYSGYVLSQDAQGCQHSAYFTVAVDEPNPWLQRGALVAGVVVITAGAWLVIRPLNR